MLGKIFYDTRVRARRPSDSDLQLAPLQVTWLSWIPTSDTHAETKVQTTIKETEILAKRSHCSRRILLLKQPFVYYNISLGK